MPLNLKDIPGGALVAACRTAAISGSINVTKEEACFYAKTACKIVSAGIVPDTALSGADTNYRKLGFRNKGTDGAGTTELALVSFTSGVDLVAHDYYELVASTALKTMTAGQVLAFYSKHEGSGLAQPAGCVIVVYWPTGE